MLQTQTGVEPQISHTRKKKNTQSYTKKSMQDKSNAAAAVKSEKKME